MDPLGHSSRMVAPILTKEQRENCISLPRYENILKGIWRGGLVGNMLIQKYDDHFKWWNSVTAALSIVAG